MGAPLINFTETLSERKMLKMNEVTRVRAVSYTSRSSQPAKLAIALWCYRLRNKELYDFAVFQTTQHRPSVGRSGFLVASCIRRVSRMCIYIHGQDNASLQYETFILFFPKNTYAETWQMRCVIIYTRIPALGARYRALLMLILMNATAHALFQTHVQLSTISQHRLQ